MNIVSRPLVLYHGNCPDGFCAAWVAHRALGDDAEYIPVNYGEAPPNVAGRVVYILDFSYKRETMLLMAWQASKLTILDHHETAADDLEGFATECSRAYGLIPPDVVFDMDKSGGRLAWEHFFPDEPAPWLVDYTEDRDLWRWTLPNAKEINAGLASRERTFEAWTAIHNDQTLYTSCQLATEGSAILRYQDQLVRAIVRNAREIQMDGHRILAANTSVLFSEVAGKLANGRPFGAAWFVRADGKTQWSLRSRDQGVDVSEIASKHGGGGHRNAAGFEEHTP